MILCSLAPNLLEQELYEGTLIQVFGDLLKHQEDNKSRLCVQVHILRNFTGVDVARYQDAIAKQSLACPRMCLRRLILDTVNSPAPSAFLGSAPINQNDISRDMFNDTSSPPDSDLESSFNNK